MSNPYENAQIQQQAYVKQIQAFQNGNNANQYLSAAYAQSVPYATIDKPTPAKWIEVGPMPRLRRRIHCICTRWLRIYCERGSHWAIFRRTSRMMMAFNLDVYQKNPGAAETWCYACKAKYMLTNGQ